MLHPAKNFAKRWAWLKSRIAEFTRPPAPDISTRHLLTNQPLHNPVAIAHSDALLRNIQARFPIVGVFAPPNLRPSIQLAPSCLRAPTSSARGLRPPTSCQFRTIVTNPSSFGHQTAQAASRLTQNQYSAFARNFSTAKAPTLFQPVNAQATIFTNLATKPFSAINQKSGCLTQNSALPEPVSLKVGRYDGDKPSRPSNSNQHNHGPNLVPAEQATMGLYASCSESVRHKCSHDAAHDASKCAKRARLVRRGSKHVSFGRSPSAALISATDPGTADCLNGKDNGRPRFVDGATTDSRKRKPPDRSRKQVYIILRLDAALFWDLSEVDDGTSSSFLFPPSPFTSLTPPRQSSGHTHLTSSLLASLTDFADLHRRHLSLVLALLQTLSEHGSYTIEINGMHIRVCLDHLSSEEAAREWLGSIGVDPHMRYFGIEVVDASESDLENLEDTVKVPASASNNQGPSAVLVTAALNSLPSHQTTLSPSASSFSSDFTSVASSLESSAVLIQPTAIELGPEYFRGIHEFLDVVNDMIETGPAFTPLSKSGMSGSPSRLSIGKN